ncbi:MAG TPA: dihydrodipicolinate synthase family protein [Trueperaceae bacterium]|nr:dihydrodipicolinate synthase family protein [Trueperaceae bacterium]
MGVNSQGSAPRSAHDTDTRVADLEDRGAAPGASERRGPDDRPAALRGVHTIMPTPFTPDGRLDEESVASLVRFLVAAGVDGVTVLGFLGEAHKLSEAEQEVVVSVAVQAAGGRVPVVAGASAGGVKVSVERALRFVELGAAGLMVAPVASDEAAVLAQYRELDEALAAGGGRLPVVVHDYPASTGVRVSPATLASLHTEVPSVTTVKLEDPPTGAKLSALKRLAPGLAVLGGLGGLHLVEELARGAAGVMTGVSFPELLVGAVRGSSAGDEARRRASAEYRKAAAFLAFEFQPGVGLAVRKEVYRRRGAIRHALVRAPGAQLDEETARELTEHLDHLHAVRPDLAAVPSA